jgi:hypothetical protein
MKSGGWFFAAWLLGLGALGWGATGYPTPVDPAWVESSPYVYTGMVRADGFTASGSAAIHPRFVLGCAHLNFRDSDATWLPAGSILWFWKRNLGSYPPDGEGMLLTGYYYFSNYQTSFNQYGDSDARTYQSDFVVNYSATQDTAGGLAAGWVEDGVMPLTKGKLNKIISGYPSSRYVSGDPDRYRMHTTDLSQDFRVSRGNYLTLSGSETGRGNSGGPVWVWIRNSWAFAGVVVSGSQRAQDQGRSLIGVCALNKNGMGLVLAAAEAPGGASSLTRKTFSLAGVPAAIPDQSTVGRTFTASGLVGVVKEVKINLAVKHQRQGDLIVTLRSPSGKTVTLLSAVAKNKSSRPDLSWSGRVVSGFSGLPANGNWTVGIRDSYRNHIGSLQSGSLQFTTR